MNYNHYSTGNTGVLSPGVQVANVESNIRIKLSDTLAALTRSMNRAESINAIIKPENPANPILDPSKGVDIDSIVGLATELLHVATRLEADLARIENLL